MEFVSYVVWAVLGAGALGFELYAVKHERKNGALPLTRVVRDRLMRKSPAVKVGVLAFLAWIFLHFTQPLPW